MNLPSQHCKALAEGQPQQRDRHDRCQGRPHLHQAGELMITARLARLAQGQRCAGAERHQRDGVARRLGDGPTPGGLKQQQGQQWHQHAGAQQHPQGQAGSVQPGAQAFQPQAQAQRQHRAEQRESDEQGQGCVHGRKAPSASSPRAATPIRLIITAVALAIEGRSL